MNELVLEAGPEAPRRAREEVLAEVGPLDPGRRLELELVVSELVTNRLRWEDAPEVVVRWSVERRQARFEIPGGEPGIEAEPERWGWGLRLLDRIATDWSVGEAEEGPVTRFSVEIRPPSQLDLSDEDEEALFARVDEDEAARAEIVRRYQNLARSIARRFRGKGVDRADLDQAATLALVKALNRYDPDQGAFSTYAARTISGELKRHLRDRGWSVRVPRSLQEASLEVGRAWQRLSQQLGRTPTVEEVAAETDRSPDQVVEALQAGTAYRAGSIDAPVGGEDGDLTVADRLGEVDDSLAVAERWQEVAEAIRSLPERERRILYLRFYEDMTQSQIAEIVGISQMHVSRLLSRSISRLRELTEP